MLNRSRNLWLTVLAPVMLRLQSSFCGIIVSAICCQLVYWHRDSAKRSSLPTNFDDILQAFDFLDSSDLIPHIFCQALDLLTIPSLSPDPVWDKIHYNTISLHNVVSKVESLESKFSTFLNCFYWNSGLYLCFCCLFRCSLATKVTTFTDTEQECF